MNASDCIKHYRKKGIFDDSLAKALQILQKTYIDEARANGFLEANSSPRFIQFLDLVAEQIQSPFSFDLFHKRIITPIDYSRFGIEFFRPLVQYERSRVINKYLIDQMIAQQQKGDNIILLANHQTEGEPQCIALLLGTQYQKFIDEMIFVAGHRVVSDPIAVPFSKGLNLLCIYSKNYIDHPPELKEQKRLHNQQTILRMSHLLSEGGKCIYVAPSGGRDRPGNNGQVDVCPFDPQSVELFWIVAQRSKKPCHFYPLALATYKILPPPNQVSIDLGEHRQVETTPIHMALGNEIDMKRIAGDETLPLKQKRELRAKRIWQMVRELYQPLASDLKL